MLTANGRPYGLHGDPTVPIAEPRHAPVPQLIEALATSAPDDPAVIWRGRASSYGELWARVDGLARALLARGVEPGDVVAVTGPKSFGLIASILAVLASGGVVLPVETALPRRRKEVMLRETHTSLVVTAHSHDRERAEIRELGIPFVDVDPESGIVDGGTIDGGSLPRLDSQSPAYVFFTSGTTGVPRAVLGRHGGLGHFLAWQRETFDVGSRDRVPQLTSLSFDVVLRDIFLPLTSGGCLHLPPAAPVEGAEVLNWLRGERATLLHAVPTLARRWLEAARGDVTLPDLRVVFFAGEPLSDVFVTRWREQLCFDGQVVNLYGPTETTLAKCCFVVPARPVTGVQPVGRPIPQTQVLVLGEHGLCGVGEAGEIVIRTPFRTLGYANDPREQRRRFVRNPYSGEPSDLVFRTRDRGRYRDDGLIEVLGRMDDQVKIRGVRVEPREAELVLERHPAVRQVAVVPRPGPAGEPQLVAYVVVEPPQQETIAELRRALHDVLPAVAVPSIFVPLDSLPVTANGKLARDELAEPSWPDAEDAGEIEHLVERRIAEIWATVLGTRPTRRADDFFALGGESLSAVRVAALLEEGFGREVAIRDILQRPTIAELAELVGASAEPAA